MTEKKKTTPRAKKKAVETTSIKIGDATLSNEPVDLSDHPAVKSGVIKNPGDYVPEDSRVDLTKIRSENPQNVPGNPKRGDGAGPED